jgi:hypothetical protein
VYKPVHRQPEMASRKCMSQRAGSQGGQEIIIGVLCRHDASRENAGISRMLQSRRSSLINCLSTKAMEVFA